MMDPNHFLMMMLCRFELYQIFSTPDYGKRFSSENTNKVHHEMLKIQFQSFKNVLQINYKLLYLNVKISVSAS